MSGNDGCFAIERRVEDLQECWFYHSMDLPGYGPVRGQWDLRGRVDAYLGGVSVAGKRVLEVGTASGFLCFEMERRGAEVVAYDLSPDQNWDVVPFGGASSAAASAAKKENIRKLNNGWWLAHRAFASKAKVVYGSVYEIPEQIGPVDIVLFGSILLHVRDPFLALQRAGALARETMIVTDIMPRLETGASTRLKRLAKRIFFRLAGKVCPYMVFLPDPAKAQSCDTWWQLSPATVSRFLQVLGFESVTVTYHRQFCVLKNRDQDLYTVVARRRHT